MRNGAQALWLQAAHTKGWCKGGIKKSYSREVKDCAGTISADGFFMALSKFWQKMHRPSACKQSRSFIYFIHRVQVVEDNFWGKKIERKTGILAPKVNPQPADSKG